MIAYGFSVQGKSHIEKNIPCQDAGRAERLEAGAYMGIVADGVGSAAYAEIGSKMAVDSLFTYCNAHISPAMLPSEMEEVLRKGYQYAMDDTEAYAKEKGIRTDAYDTTLSAVIFDEGTVVYAHAGDGGIIVRCKDGQIEAVTSRQKGADGVSVRPLRAGDSSWEFGMKKDVAAVLLLTDGMLDGVVMPMLINLPSDWPVTRQDMKKAQVYVTAAEFFMNPEVVYLNRSIKDPDEYMGYFIDGNLSKKDQDKFLKYIQMGYERLLGTKQAADLCRRIRTYCYMVWAVSNIADDKSVVCLIDEGAEVIPKTVSYYEEPDWKALMDNYQTFLYGQTIRKEHTPDTLEKRKKREIFSWEKLQKSWKKRFTNKADRIFFYGKK